MSSKIEIPISKTKAALPIIFLLVIGILGILSILSPELFVSKVSKYNSPDSIRAIGMAVVVISLVLTILFIRKFFTKKMGLIIDKEGITDNSSATYPGLIEWNDITGIKKVKNGPIKSIILLTDKPEKYINKAKKMSRPTMGKTLRFHGSPIMLVPSRLKIKYDDLVNLITTEFEKKKRTTTQNKTH